MSDDPLDQINRFVVVLLTLLVAFAALVLVLLAWGASTGTIEWLEDLAGWLRDHDHSEAKTIFTLGAIVIVLLMVTVVIIEIAPAPNPRMSVRHVGSSDVSLTTQQVAARIETEAAQDPNVAACEATVIPHGKRIEIVLDLHVEAGADLARTADIACRRAETIITREMALELAKPPRARMHYRELRLREARPASKQRPAAAASPSSTGWERPHQTSEERDERPNADAPEEAQA